MNVYIAAPWACRQEVPAVDARLEEEGHYVVSRWHREWLNTDTSDPLRLAQEAQMDWNDVKSSDVMVVLNLQKSEGKAVEQGLALACRIPIIVIGAARFNVFQYLAQVRLVPTLDDAVRLLAQPLY